MKTFEERYTAWIDGQLENGALTAFEHELERRAAVGEAEADRTDAARLRTLLQTHFQAPALTNPDFFNHQLLGRIEAEAAPSRRGREAAGQTVRSSLFAWGFARLVGLGAFSLFAAAALYYGLIPSRSGTGNDTVASRRDPIAVPGLPSNGNQVAENPVPAASPQPVSEGTHGGGPNIELAKRSPTPTPIEETLDIKTFVPDQPANPTTATPLHYNKPNVNVLWLNGLDYLPNVPDADAAPAAPVPATTAAP